MINKEISHYKILKKIGGGGMGVVYSAIDTKLNRKVALKFLPPELTQDEESKKRFINEAQTASKLEHPNICTIYEIDETDEGQIFIAMSYYEGKTLKEKLNEGPLSVEESINIVVQLAWALSKAHSKGIIHRDVKPANIFITDEGQVKLLDFGLAKLASETRITRTGTTMGTANYISPEQARGDIVDHRTDIWSLGVVLYEMLAGVSPFYADNWEAVLYSIFNKEPDPIKDIPDSLQRVVMKMLEKNPADRYHSMDNVIKELSAPVSLPSLETSKIIKIKEYIVDKKRRKTIISLISLISLMIIFFFLSPVLFDEARASRKIPVAIMFFDNNTGDDSYNYLSQAIPNLLIASLEQSKYLSVMTWERIHDLLNIRGEKDKDIDEEIAFEICRMDGREVVVLGSFTKTEALFETNVKVIDVNSKEILKTASSRGEGVSSILNKQIDELSRDISEGAGLSERRIKSIDKPITSITTSSMEAYNYFLRGREDLEKFYFDDARKFLERAIDIDSTFATAYLYLALIYNWLGETIKMNESYEKAKEFSYRATEKERLYIESEYASIIEKDEKKYLKIKQEIADKYPKEKRIYRDLGVYYSNKKIFDKALEEFNKALKLDPNYAPVYNHLGYLYSDMGKFNEAIEYFKKYATLSPGDANPFDSMAEIYFIMGNLSEALSKYREALDVKPDFGSEWRIAYIYALKENYTESIKWIDKYIDKAPSIGIEGVGYKWKWLFNFWIGNYSESFTYLQKAADIYDTLENEWERANIDWDYAVTYLNLGKIELGREYLKKWSDFWYKETPKLTYAVAANNFRLGLFDLKEGKIDSAESRLPEMEKVIPELEGEDRERIEVFYNFLNSEILLSRGEYNEVIKNMEDIHIFEIPKMVSFNLLLRYNLPFIRDVKARAYAKMGELDKAIGEYEKLITIDKKDDRRLIYPLYHYRLAKIYEAKGNKEKAIEQYEKLLEIWKNADESIEEKRDAMVRLAKIKRDT